MPEQTQKQWLEKQIAAWPVTQGYVVAGIDRPSSEVNGNGALAAYLASAWPSSPQGQAVKQLVAATEDYVEGDDYGCHTVSCRIDQGEECTCGMQPLLVALDATRKAGLG